MSLIDLLFPSDCKCIFCSQELYDGYICSSCSHEISYITKACIKCGGTLTGDGDVCLECKKYERVFDKGYCVCDYTGRMQEKILKFKNHNGKYLGHAFAQMMLDKYKQLDCDIDVIIPIPIHVNRRKTRGFNQSEILAEKINDYTHMVDNTILIRKKDTPHQVGLNRENRIVNVTDAFLINKGKSVNGKNILIIDDIFTTGTTIDECAKYLKSMGANKIFYLCLARTPIGDTIV